MDQQLMAARQGIANGNQPEAKVRRRITGPPLKTDFQNQPPSGIAVDVRERVQKPNRNALTPSSQVVFAKCLQGLWTPQSAHPKERFSPAAFGGGGTLRTPIDPAAAPDIINTASVLFSTWEDSPCRPSLGLASTNGPKLSSAGILWSSQPSSVDCNNRLGCLPLPQMAKNVENEVPPSKSNHSSASTLIEDWLNEFNVVQAGTPSAPPSPQPFDEHLVKDLSTRNTIQCVIQVLPPDEVSCSAEITNSSPSVCNDSPTIHGPHSRKVNRPRFSLPPVSKSSQTASPATGWMADLLDASNAVFGSHRRSKTLLARVEKEAQNPDSGRGRHVSLPVQGKRAALTPVAPAIACRNITVKMPTPPSSPEREDFPSPTVLREMLIASGYSDAILSPPLTPPPMTHNVVREASPEPWSLPSHYESDGFSESSYDSRSDSHRASLPSRVRPQSKAVATRSLKRPDSVAQPRISRIQEAVATDPQPRRLERRTWLPAAPDIYIKGRSKDGRKAVKFRGCEVFG